MELDPLAPNAEDQDGEYFDPWEALGLSCASYNSAVDDDALAVLRAISDGGKAGHDGGEYKNYVTDIAKLTGLAETHVELYQYLFCSAGWCEYGTSPRGCWFIEDDFGDRIIAAWEAYYKRRWEGSE